jgi:hypothetical protein
MHINTEVTMKSIALAVLIATLAGCAIVPYGPPPVYVGVHARGGYYDHGYRY